MSISAVITTIGNDELDFSNEIFPMTELGIQVFFIPLQHTQEKEKIVLALKDFDYLIFLRH